MILNRLVPHLRTIAIRRARNVICEQVVLSNWAVFNTRSQWQRKFSSHVSQSNDETIELVTKLDTKQSADPKAWTNNAVDRNSRETDNVDIDDVPIPELKKSQCTAHYVELIQEHLKSDHLKAAIAVVETQMIRKDRVQPDESTLTLLMGECGRLGFAKKCFQLYKLLGTCGYKPTEETFTNLLNACLLTPYHNDGLVYVRRTCNEMRKKNYKATALQQNLLIQVYGQCNKLDTAVSILDTLKKKDVPIDINTFKLLLHIAAKNSESGFRYALILWQKMYDHNVKPDIYAFHLLLKCVCDCGIGDVETTKKAIDKLVSSSSKRNAVCVENTANLDLQTNVTLDNTPNLLSRAPRLGTLIPLEDVEEAEHRLLLLGGIANFLNELNAYNLTPTLGTFMQLINAIPSTIVAETKLLRLMRAAEIVPDMRFLNLLLKKRCMAADYIESKDVLNLIANEKLEPDAETFGLLSYSCKNMEEIDDFLDVLAEHSSRPNIIAYESFLRNACEQNSFEFIEQILNMVKQRGFFPSRQFLELLDNYCADYPKKFLINKNPSKYTVIGFAKFSRLCRRWKKEMKYFEETGSFPPTTTQFGSKNRRENNRKQPEGSGENGANYDRNVFKQRGAAGTPSTQRIPKMARKHPEAEDGNAANYDYSAATHEDVVTLPEPRTRNTYRKQSEAYGKNAANDDRNVWKQRDAKHPEAVVDGNAVNYDNNTTAHRYAGTPSAPRIPKKHHNKFTTDKNASENPWDTFERNQPEGVDVNSHHRPTEKKRRRHHRRRKNSMDKQEKKIQFVDQDMYRPDKSKNPFKKEAQPPSLSHNKLKSR